MHFRKIDCLYTVTNILSHIVTHTAHIYTYNTPNKTLIHSMGSAQKRTFIKQHFPCMFIQYISVSVSHVIRFLFLYPFKILSNNYKCIAILLILIADNLWKTLCCSISKPINWFDRLKRVINGMTQWMCFFFYFRCVANTITHIYTYKYDFTLGLIRAFAIFLRIYIIVMHTHFHTHKYIDIIRQL